MEYQVIQSEISMDERDLIIVLWQIVHQPVGEFIHDWDVSVGCRSVLLCPGGHLQDEKDISQCYQSDSISTSDTRGVQCVISLVSCSNPVLFQTLQGSVTQCPRNASSPAFPLQRRTERSSRPDSLRGDGDL